MDFLRAYIIILIFLCSPLFAANAANPGIAFIHGTQDHREDAFGDYWKVDFLLNIAGALPNPANYFVVHCNFKHYMWHDEAAGCVAEQLAQFVREKDITSLTIYTHSNGANVIRWILSNPTYENHYLLLKQKVSKVIAIAPSSGGTSLADEVLNGGIFNTGVGWLLGYLADAIKQQRVGDMLIYNHELLLGGLGRPALTATFKSIVGTDVAASPFSAASYCNGYFLNSSLKFTKLYLDKCSDGFLNCTSQAAAGDVWFYDKEKTYEQQSLNHNQSRHSCSDLDKILIEDLQVTGAKS